MRPRRVTGKVKRPCCGALRKSLCPWRIKVARLIGLLRGQPPNIVLHRARGGPRKRQRRALRALHRRVLRRVDAGKWFVPLVSRTHVCPVNIDVRIGAALDFDMPIFLVAFCATTRSCLRHGECFCLPSAEALSRLRVLDVGTLARRAARHLCWVSITFTVWAWVPTIRCLRGNDVCSMFFTVRACRICASKVSFTVDRILRTVFCVCCSIRRAACGTAIALLRSDFDSPCSRARTRTTTAAAPCSPCTDAVHTCLSFWRRRAGVTVATRCGGLSKVPGPLGGRT